MNTIKKFVSNSFLLYLVFVLATTATPVKANGVVDYLQTGYPIISIVGGTFLIATAYYISYHSRKVTGGILNDRIWRENGLFTFFLIFIYCCGIFLIFGPDNFGSVENPRSAIIGLQLLFQVAIGVYMMYHPSPIITDLYIIFGLFNLLGLFGSNLLFNYNLAIWVLGETDCNSYFSGDGSETFTRCDDDGYLQFLRIMGHLVSLVLLTSIIYAVASAYENGQRLFSYGGQQAGVPTTAGQSTATTSAYPNPTYGKEVPTTTTTNVSPATSVPVNY